MPTTRNPAASARATPSAQATQPARAAAPYAGGKPESRCGGHVGNVGGFGGAARLAGIAAASADVGRPAQRGSRQASVGPGRRASPLRGRAPARCPAARAPARSAPAATPAGAASTFPRRTAGRSFSRRRHFLFGAIGVTALAAAGGAASVVLKQREEAAGNVTVLEVPASAVTALNTSASESAFTLVEDASARMGLSVRAELPYGSLVWASGDDVAACLLPTEEAKPLAQVGLLSLGSGNLSTVLERAVGQEEGFEIYDVRATASGLVWTEADILDGLWRVYTARLADGVAGDPHLVDEGDGQWETPTIAAAGAYAFWQVLPKVDGDYSAEDSLVKRASLGSGDVDTVYTSHGRPCTPPYALADSVVITPRADTAGTYYQLTHLDAASGNVLDTMVLPRSMRPLEAGYGDNGFSFSFDAWYNYGDGISQIGTYTPASRVTDGNYSDAPWFSFQPRAHGSPCLVRRLLHREVEAYRVRHRPEDERVLRPPARERRRRLWRVPGHHRLARLHRHLRQHRRQAHRRRPEEILPGKGVEAGRLRSIRACSGQAARPRHGAERF